MSVSSVDSTDPYLSANVAHDGPDDPIATSSNAHTSGTGAIAHGAESMANHADRVSVGATARNEKIGHVAACVKGTDPVDVDQLNRQKMSRAVGHADSHIGHPVPCTRRDA
jgi:autotransporter adhesin